jgi:hypothetical protein
MVLFAALSASGDKSYNGGQQAENGDREDRVNVHFRQTSIRIPPISSPPARNKIPSPHPSAKGFPWADVFRGAAPFQRGGNPNTFLEAHGHGIPHIWE